MQQKIFRLKFQNSQRQIFSFLLLSAIVLFFPVYILSQEVKEGIKGTTDLETTETFDLTRKLNFHLWSDLNFHVNLDDKTRTFDQHHVYLIGESKMSESFRAYTEIEFEHGAVIKSQSTGTTLDTDGSNDGIPDSGSTASGGELKIERAFGEFAFADFLKIRAGKFLNQYALWNPMHWEPLTPAVTRPISANNQFIPKNGTGIAILGSIFLSSLEINYTLYTQNGKGKRFDNKDNNKHFANGGDLYLEWDEKIRIGNSYWIDETTDGIYKVWVAYARLSLWRFQLDVEYLYKDSAGDNDDINTYYIQPGIRINDMFSIYYRFNHADHDPKLANGMEHDLHVGSIVFEPITAVRIKVDYILMKSKDAGMADRSIAFNASFMY